jgi:hypothetical protein
MAGPGAIGGKPSTGNPDCDFGIDPDADNKFDPNDENTWRIKDAKTYYALCEELGIDVPEAPLTAFAIAILYRLRDKGAVIFNSDDSDIDDKTRTVLQEICEAGGIYFARTHDKSAHQFIVARYEEVTI